MTDTTTTSRASGLGLYRLCMTATTGLDGAPTLHLSLLVDAVRRTVTGQGRQVQPIDPPNDEVSIDGISGRSLSEFVLGQPEQLITLQGKGVVAPPPPLMTVMVEPFSAVLRFEDAEHGVVSWTLGGQSFHDVPFTTHPC